MKALKVFSAASHAFNVLDFVDIIMNLKQTFEETNFFMIWN